MCKQLLTNSLGFLPVHYCMKYRQYSVLSFSLATTLERHQKVSVFQLISFAHSNALCYQNGKTMLLNQELSYQRVIAQDWKENERHT